MIKKLKRCPVCGSKRIVVNENGDFRCKKCGYIHKKDIRLNE